MRRIWLPLQCDHGGQASYAPHHRVFRVDATYGRHKERARRVAPAASVRPDLQQSNMSTGVAMRCVANPIALHEAIRAYSAWLTEPCTLSVIYRLMQIKANACSTGSMGPLSPRQRSRLSRVR